jgi:hypothetical protein
VIFSQPPQVIQVLFSDQVPFLKGGSLELTWPYFRNIVGKDRTYRLINGDNPCG